MKIKENKSDLPIHFRKASWESYAILSDLKKDSIDLSIEIKNQIHDEMWRNLVAEYDSVHLSHRIRHHTEKFSPEFLHFEHIWLADEMNHYIGLRQIYSTLFDLEEPQVHDQVSSRKPNFSEIEEFLGDEFVLCVCFAYDELASTRGYAEAFQLYDSFNVRCLRKWIRLAARDEMYHSLNARQILQVVHPHHLQNVPHILRKIVETDQSRRDGYKGTFLFDHDHDPENNPFSGDFLKKCANDICRSLSTSLAFQEPI